MGAYYIKKIKHYHIYKTRNPKFERQYIIWNTLYPFKMAHSHVRTLGQCESIVQHILNRKEPIRRSGWKEYNDILKSIIRIVDHDDHVYINHIINLINNKEVKRYCQEIV